MEVDFSKEKLLGLVLPYIEKKRVLDVGCIEHDMDRIDKLRTWVHGFLKQYTAHVVGIDIVQDAVQALRSKGYDVHCQNAEDFHFDEKFEVIFAGELIEHLGNPGAFLERCHSHLKQDGLLILTTPNAFCLQRLLTCLLSRTNDPGANTEHTFWSSPKVLGQLTARYGFRLVELKVIDYPFRIRMPRKMAAASFLCNFFGDRYRETIFAVFRLDESD